MPLAAREKFRHKSVYGHRTCSAVLTAELLLINLTV